MKKNVSGEIILPGSKVVVENYRSHYNTPEAGHVVKASLIVFADGESRPSYTVHLDRRGKYNRPIRLYVGSEGISLFNSADEGE
jgi:hypothetical protein